MRQSSFTDAARFSSKHATRKFNQSSILKAITFFSLLAITLVTLILNRNLVVNTQAQQAASGITAASSYQESLKFENSSKKSDKSANEQTVADVPAANDESLVPPSGCGWTAAAAYPIPIADSGVTAIGNNIYSFGGVGNGVTVAFAFRFNGTTWTTINSLPQALLKPAVVSDGTYAYIIGGFVTGTGTVNTVYRYDPATSTYTTLAPAITPTWSSAAVFLNGKIYKIAGFTTIGTNAVEIYDIATNTWTTGASYPQALGSLSAVAVGNFIYTAGGIESQTNVDTAKTYQYNPATNFWDDSAIADLPATRWGSASALYVGNFVLAGGATGLSFAGNAIAWDATTNTWNALPTPVAPNQYRFSGAVINGAFYAFGGNPFGGTTNNQRLLCDPLDDPVITNSVTYISESGVPLNRTPDPGETVTIGLALENAAGVAPTGNLSVTLQATGGIVPVTTTQTYGVLAPGGAATSRNFTFTVPASAVCGSQVTLTFVVTDGTTTTSVTRTFTLGILGPPGATTNFSNNAPIIINDNSPATPYPATIAVSGLTGTAYNVSLTLNGFSHPSPEDVDILLVGPGGQKLIVLSDLGGGVDVVNADITLSDAAPTLIGNVIVTGTYKPTNVDFAQDIFPAPAPVGPYQLPFPSGAATLNSVFGTGTFNGNWSLYVVDDFVTEFGSISGGWTITFQEAPVRVCSTVGGTPESRADFNADGKTDVSVFRNGNWFVQQSGGPFVSVQFGAAGDQIVPGDYDADNKTDYAVFRPGSPANFYVLNSSNLTFSSASWGGTGDIPLTGDFTGDGRSDFTVYRPSNNTWYTFSPANSSVTIISIGTAGQTPVTLDYDGDGTTDRALWNSSNGVWTLRRSSDASVVAVQFGATGDKLVPADYDGDNKEDLAVYRGGQWIALLSGTNAAVFINFGAPTDVPVPGDYDGDGKDDQAVYRDGVWYINASTSGFSGVSFGAPTDKPVPAGYLPQ